ncbi:ECF transporter S component [Bhargavaea beijingensis]|uniref:Alpha-ribazole transporter n=1 Tax=Bhargavaea beijingensis TaxID=426756 RepID=A0A1G7DSH2_9BACL|nr:ECF transporter S component [Bhargavaea beijingensis]MCW1928919.1 ECF transporter S component [Bhargavaea beijingensis]SDE54443.1 Protein of unknown function [Bhargavaea beijingensis]
MKRTRLLALTAMVSALCAIGALVKIPMGIGSAALDSAPALLSAVFLPPAAAGTAAMIGHLISAVTGGTPLGPFHLLIAAEMFVVIGGFAWLHHHGRNVLKWGFFLIGNGVLAVLPFYWLVSPAFFWTAIVAIPAATLVNAVIAGAVMPIVRKAVAGEEVAR